MASWLVTVQKIEANQLANNTPAFRIDVARLRAPVDDVEATELEDPATGMPYYVMKGWGFAVPTKGDHTDVRQLRSKV